MSTILYLRNSTDMVAGERWSSGTNTLKDDGNAGTWRPWFPMRTERGSSTQSGIGFNTVASATYYIEGYQSSIPVQFVSPPLAQDITISGTVTFNFWGAESNMSANCGFSCKVYRIRGSDGSIQDLVNKSADGVELAVTTADVRNWTATPTSTNFLKGDRILLIPCINAVGTMGGGYTAFLTWNGSSGGASGDSYIMFTENFGFIATNPGTEQVRINSDGIAFELVGQASANQRQATCFFWDGGTLTSAEVFTYKVGSPTDNIELAVQADSAGNPSGTDLASASVVGSTLTVGGAFQSYDFTDVALGTGKYWLVLRRSGSVDGANYYALDRGAPSAGAPAQGCLFSWLNTYSGTWGITRGVSLAFKLHGGQAGTTLYPTNTAGGVDPNGATYDSKEIWTSRGAGVQTSATTLVAGWAAPILSTVSAGGNYVEWFSRPVQAFTLGGSVFIHLRVKTNLSDVGTFRVQLAVCANDGTTPVVWAENGYFGDPGQTETVTEIWLSGDDVSVTDGQRLRIRVYADDESNTPMVVSNTLTYYYAGSAGATGDSYLILPQVLAEYTGGGSTTVALIQQVGVAYGVTITHGAYSLPALSLINQSGTAFAIARVDATVVDGFISQVGVLFAPSITPGNANVAAGFIAQTGVTFAPSITPGAINVSAGFIAQVGVTFGVTTVASQEVNLGFVSQAGVTFAPSITAGNANVAAALISQTGVLFAIARTDATQAIGLISQVGVLFSLNTAFPTTQNLGFISNVGVLFSPSVTAGNANVAAGFINQSGATFSPSITPGAISLPALGLISQVGVLFSPSITHGNLNVALGFVSQAGATFGLATSFPTTQPLGFINQTGVALALTTTAGSTVDLGFISQAGVAFALQTAFPTTQNLGFIDRHGVLLGVSSDAQTPALGFVSQVGVPFALNTAFPTTTPLGFITQAGQTFAVERVNSVANLGFINQSGFANAITRVDATASDSLIQQLGQALAIARTDATQAVVFISQAGVAFAVTTTATGDFTYPSTIQQLGQSFAVTWSSVLSVDCPFIQQLGTTSPVSGGAFRPGTPAEYADWFIRHVTVCKNMKHEHWNKTLKGQPLVPADFVVED